MRQPTDIVLTRTECEALWDMLDAISGGNADNVFAWDGSDTLTNPQTRALVKVFCCAGRDVPENLDE